MARARAALVAALMVAAAPVLAGCVGSAQATAMDALDPAEQAAKAWNVDARLASAVGLEGQWVSAPMSDAGTQERAQAAGDGTIGDGRAEWWIYRFVAEGQARVLVVKVAQDGEVAWTREESRKSDDVPLGDWSVDSDEALLIAKENNDGLRVGTDKENFGIVATLKRGDADARATWHVMGGGGDETGGGGGFVRIDATNGEVLSSSGGFGTS